MRYYKTIDSGYIVSVGTGNGSDAITEQEYAEILATIRNKPTARDGYDYKLKTDLTWELAAMPPIEPEEEEPTPEERLDDIEAALVELAELIGGD